MAEKFENIGKRDVAWSYVAITMTVGAGVILLPFILHKMPAETVGIWNIFQVITAMVLLLDFGFRPSFARNISYIFSGVKELQVNGVAHVTSDSSVDYTLLKSLLASMRKFYRCIALAVFVLLASAGTAYFYYILGKYDGDRQDAMQAWILLIIINCYNLYTFYYEALLTGKGYVMRTQQITILGQMVYLGAAIGLIYAGFGLRAIVAAQLISTIIRRVLSYRVFFTPEMKKHLAEAQDTESRETFQAIVPNAVKVGLTHVGGFLVNKSALLMGSAFLTLADVACYGITIQVMDILARCSMVLYQSWIPKIAQSRAENDYSALRRYYGYCTLCLVVIYIVGGLVWITTGEWALNLIGSQAAFVATPMLLVMLAISLLEHNHVIAAGFIMADNRIPFFIPSLISGAATVILLWLFLSPLHWGLWGLILAPGIAQLAYQNWKWPSVIISELFIQNKLQTKHGREK